jgi:SAM-dependent methyltransferase
MPKNNDYYDNHVSELNAQYLALDAQEVHHSWLSTVRSSGKALDVGTGVGRDAAYLAELGYEVTAVDPSANMLRQAQMNYPNSLVQWIQDELPRLTKVKALAHKYDMILVSAVWQHIPPSQRERAIRTLSGLLAPSGKLIITLRHGEFSDGRSAYPVSVNELNLLSKQFGLNLFQPNQGELQEDLSKRAGIKWETVVLTLPDDGTGAFPLLRHIVINDSKAATYKVALLRSILRIAEGHIGALVEKQCTNTQVAVPLGLVAMYWLKLFKPLIDTYQMPQNSNPNKGLGFVKATGWDKLKHLTNNDIFIGALFNDDAHAMHSTLLHITQTIKDMPAKYITLPGTKTAVFDVDRWSPKKPNGMLMLDYQYLLSFGVFYVPREIWNTLTLYSCWIEPALVNEWIRVMRTFHHQTARQFTTDDYHSALVWEKQTRSTEKVRQRVESLQTKQDVLCTWSKSKLFTKFDIDHAFPFSRWPNNDLWNLLPSKPNINRQKSDKLLTVLRLKESKDTILNFWAMAWAKEESLFFSQANLSLPELTIDNRDFINVFEAMLSQRQRIKDTQQLADW